MLTASSRFHPRDTRSQNRLGRFAAYRRLQKEPRPGSRQGGGSCPPRLPMRPRRRRPPESAILRLMTGRRLGVGGGCRRPEGRTTSRPPCCVVVHGERCGRNWALARAHPQPRNWANPRNLVHRSTQQLRSWSHPARFAHHPHLVAILAFLPKYSSHNRLGKGVCVFGLPDLSPLKAACIDAKHHGLKPKHG